MQKLADLQGELLTGDRPMIHSPESIRKPDVMERIAYLQYQRVLRDGTYSKLESVLTTHKKSLKVKSEKKAPKPPARKGKKLAMELPPNAS
jgi:hypothetical protein